MHSKDESAHARPRGLYLQFPRRYLPGSILRRTSWTALVIVILFYTLTISRIKNYMNEHVAPLKPFHRTSEHDASRSSMLHLVIPASSPKPNLCRTLLSAALLNYPLPTMINWGLEEDEDDEYKLHLAKINGILAYLRGLPPRNDQDLVLITDGYDIWFQLRPDVLIERYHKLNNELLERAMHNVDPGLEAAQSIKQTVLFGADKKCWPQSPEHPACYSVPQSTLPENIFGDKTDHDPNSNAVRPRWLNSGTILGPISDVRAIFETAAYKTGTRFHGERDQWYFAEIFGEQEYHRNTLRPSNVTKPSSANVAAPPPTRRQETADGDDQFQLIPALEPGQRLEFYIGLDYESQLFHTMTHAAADVDFVTFNDTAGNWSSILQKHNVSIHPGNVISTILPDDIARSPPPLFVDLLSEVATEGTLDIADDISESLPVNTTWGDVPLMVNFPAKSIPVIIHINGDKSLIDPFWKLTWWSQKHWGRHLLRSGSRAPRGPIATTIDPDGGKRTWWKGGYNSLLRENGGVWTDKGEWVPWNSVCGDYGDILYDGKDAGTPPDPRLRIEEKKAQQAAEAKAAEEAAAAAAQAGQNDGDENQGQENPPTDSPSHDNGVNQGQENPPAESLPQDHDDTPAEEQMGEMQPDAADNRA